MELPFKGEWMLRYSGFSSPSRGRPRFGPMLLLTIIAVLGQSSSSIAAQRADQTEDDGQWIRPAKDFASTRYSTLNQITSENIKQLKLAWSFSTGVNRGQEAAPLVVGSTMYVVTAYPNILYALDLSKPGASMKWKYEPKPASASQRVACCDVVNRGASYADGKIVFNTLDVQTVAVDATSGKELWKTRLGDINRGETTTWRRLSSKIKYS